MRAKRGDNTMKEETRIALLEQSIEHISETLLRIEKRFDSIDNQFNKVDERFDRVDRRFEEVERKIERVDTKVDNNFRWLIGTIITLFILNGFMPIVSHAISKFF